jgi:hypothetical protein
MKMFNNNQENLTRRFEMRNNELLFKAIVRNAKVAKMYQYAIWARYVMLAVMMSAL